MRKPGKQSLDFPRKRPFSDEYFCESTFFDVRGSDFSRLRGRSLDEYSLGLAAVLKAKAEFPDIEYIVTGGNWNGYTPEAKDYGWKNGIGIFNTGEFFGALNWTEPKKYYKKDHEGNPTYAYKSP